jgi:NAD-dependent deacetylase
MPKCPTCGTVLKPEIVFFGENLPEQAISRAVAESQKADLMLVLGSSLVVYPAASLPGLTLSAGGNIVIVNDMPTYLDRDAKLHFDDLESTFTGLEKAFGATGAV